MRAHGILALLFAAAVSPVLPAQFVEGDVYVVQGGNAGDAIFKLDVSTGTYSTFATGINYPSMLHFHTNGKLLACSYTDAVIYEFDSTGARKVVLDASDGVTTPFGTNGLVQDAQGRLYISNFLTGQVLRFDADYTNMTVFADASDGIQDPEGLAFDGAGNLWIASRYNRTVLTVAPDGSSSIFDNPPQDPVSIACRDNGDVYVLLTGGDLYRYAGGVAANRTLLGNYPAGIFGALGFSRDGQRLQLTEYGAGNFVEIDPDTGARTVVVSGMFGPLGYATYGAPCEEPGGFTTFGTGLAGTGGLVPSLNASGNPSPGGQITLESRDFVGGATSLYMFGVGTFPFSALGGILYVDFTKPKFFLTTTLPGTPGQAGAGDVDLPFNVPNTSELCVSIYAQHFGFDPAAPKGISMSNALEIDLGL